MDFMSRDQSREPEAWISVEDCVNIEVGSLYKYVWGSSERLLLARPRGLMATKDENILDEGEQKESVSQRIKVNQLQTDKSLHGPDSFWGALKMLETRCHGIGWKEGSWRKRPKVS